MLGWFERHSKISWIVTLIGAIAIFYISSLTFGAGTYSTNSLSILYHFFAFFCFGFFLQISSLKGKKRYSIFFLVLAIAVIYGASDELHQYFVPGRTTTFSDFVIDSLGVLLASLIYITIVQYREYNNMRRY